jgi:hypothetical protein
MQFFYSTGPSACKEKWKNSVYKTGHAGSEYSNTKTPSSIEMFHIGFVDAAGVTGKWIYHFVVAR